MKSLLLFVLLFALVGKHEVTAQPDSSMLAHDELFVMGDAGEDPTPDLIRYDQMNRSLGADSVRLCNGRPCSGWVEDRYDDLVLKHRGYYEDGQLVVYKNFHPNGALEREFKGVDNVKSVLRTYHPNGQLRSEARFANGVTYQYEDHYVDGRLRYSEEKHRTEPYYIRMDLFAANGDAVSVLQLVDKKRIEFEQKEFHPGGGLRSQGRARYDRARMDTRRIGTWTYFDTAGKVVREEDYSDGKVAAVR